VQGELGRVKEALQCYFKANQLNDKTPEPLMAVARLHGAGGQVKEAVAYARQAVSLAPRDPALRRQMADFLAGLGLKDLAREERQLAEVLDKANRDPLD
jgi:Flp pilus assembly protein TadD